MTTPDSEWSNPLEGLDGHDVVENVLRAPCFLSGAQLRVREPKNCKGALLLYIQGGRRDHVESNNPI